MPIILPDNHPHFAALIKNGIECISNKNPHIFSQQTINVGIVNIMPHADKYELFILKKLGYSEFLINPVWIRVENHKYKSTNKDHLTKFYTTFKDAITNNIIHGLIITGAPVELMEFKQVTYWDELLGIFEYAEHNIKNTLGLCWGGMAIGKYLGVDKIIFAEKICGVYHTNNLETNHPISGALGDFFDCPQSRYASFDENSLKNNSQITPLVFAEGAGHYIIESKDRRFMAHNGHPEYDVERILFEHRRDKLAGLSHIPINFDLENPIDTWTQKGIMFFNAWINFIAEKNNSE